jgi:hypothetical protein
MSGQSWGFLKKMINPDVRSREQWLGHTSFKKHVLESAADQIKAELIRNSSHFGGETPHVFVDDRENIVIQIEGEDEEEATKVMQETVVDRSVSRSLEGLGDILDDAKERVNAESGRTEGSAGIDKISKSQERALRG